MTKALILAGGSGSDLLPLTLHLPQPMLPIGNYPLVLFQLQQLKRGGCREVILSLPYPPRQIKPSLGEGGRLGMVLRYSIESSPQGTAGAFRHVRNLIEGTTVILNGDVLSSFPLSEMLDDHARRGALVTIGTCRVPNPHAFGIVETDADGRVTGFVERPRGRRVKNNRINAGVYAVEPELLEIIDPSGPSFFETDLFPELVRQRREIVAFEIGQDWTEITRPANYLQSNMDFLEGRIERPSFAAFPPAPSPKLDKSISLDSNTIVADNCVLKSRVRVVQSVIGANCRLEEGAFIRNSVLWPGCTLGKGAVVSGSVLGRGCQIGQGCYLRAGNILGDKTVITAFSRC